MTAAYPGTQSANTAASKPPMLLNGVRERIRARHYSRRTEEAYVQWVRRFVQYHGKRHPSEMECPQSKLSLLIWPSVENDVSASTANQSLAALLFLSRDVLAIQRPGLNEGV